MGQKLFGVWKLNVALYKKNIFKYFKFEFFNCDAFFADKEKQLKHFYINKQNEGGLVKKRGDFFFRSVLNPNDEVGVKFLMMRRRTIFSFFNRAIF
jgi:hypothetical protein